MKKHTRATPAGVPRSRSKLTRAIRKRLRPLMIAYRGVPVMGSLLATGPIRVMVGGKLRYVRVRMTPPT